MTRAGYTGHGDRTDDFPGEAIDASPGIAMSGGVKSGYRVIQLFEYFRNNPGPARGTDIAMSIPMPASSANELLKTLVDCGYLTFDAVSKRYSLSLQILTLADTVAAHDPKMRGLIAAASAIQRDTGDNVAIFVRNQNRMQFVYKLFGSYQAPTASRVPILGTAAGGALLMSMRRTDAMAVIRTGTRLAMPGERDVAIRRVSDEISRFRAQGFALSNDETHPPDVRAIAVPVEPTASQPGLMFGFGGRNLASELGQIDSARRVAKMLKDVIRCHTAA